MARKYYTLIVYEDAAWSPQFGDYDRQVVEDEMADYQDHGKFKKHLRIIRTNDDQAAINQAVGKLNAVYDA